MKDKIRDVFDVLQEMDIKGTPHNVRILNAVYNTLREIYEELERRDANGSETDPGGRDDD